MQFPLTLSLALAFAVGATAQSTWFVDPAGSNGNSGTSAGSPFLTINHANSVASSGDVIMLAAGTYGNAQGVIVLGDKNVTVIGAGAGVTTLTAHSTMTVNIPTGFPGAPVPTAQRVVVLVQGAGRVDFRGICFDGNFAMPANGRLSGVYFRGGADGLLEDCEVKNCRANPLSGSQAPAGIVVRGDAGDISLVQLRNTYVHDFGKAGLVALFNAQIEVDECRFLGADRVGVGFPAQVGVQISYDAGGSVRRSTFGDFWYTPTTYAATAVLNYDAGIGVDVHNCGFGNCEQAIYCVGVTNNAGPVSIRRNRIHACDTGVALDSVGYAAVVDNSIHSKASGTPVVWDTNPLQGHNWTNNSYSDYTGAVPYPVPGGPSVDPVPAGDVRLVNGLTTTTALPVGHAPYGIAVADFNGDGFDDFATADLNGGVTVTVGLNTGGGSFTVNSQVIASATAAPVGIVTGEFNSQPGIDLAVATTNVSPATIQNRVHVLTNNGSGVFTWFSVTALSGFVDTTGIAVGDVDGSGADDLVVTDAGSGGGGKALLLKNTGIGLFTAWPLPGSYTTELRAAVITPLLGSGFFDVVVLLEGDNLGGRVHLLMGDGAGNFAVHPSSPLGMAIDPKAAAASDFDGDGDMDLLAASDSLAAGQVTVFENLGAATFRRSTIPVNGSATGLAVGDLDNDADPDTVRGDAAVVNFNGGTVTLLGSFVSGVGFDAGGIAAFGSAPSGAGFGNFDGDGYDDLYYCDALAGTVTVKSGVVQARADSFGTGVAGKGGKVPYIRPFGIPGATQPNVTHGIQLASAAPTSWAGLVISLAPASPLTPGLPQVAFGPGNIAWILPTDSFGQASFALQIPAAPSVPGWPLYCEVGVLDLAAPSLYGINVAMSKGLKIRLGN